MNTSRIVYTSKETKGPGILSKKAPKIAGVSVLFILLVSSLFYLARLPNWQVANFSFSGLKTLDQNMLQKKVMKILEGNYALIIPKRSFFFVNSDKLSKAVLNDFPNIQSVSVTKKFPDSVKIAVEERELWGIFCAKAVKKDVAAQCVYVDKTGFAYEQAPDSAGFLITRINTEGFSPEVPSQILEPPLTERMLFLAEELRKNLGLEVIGYELSKKVPREIWVVTSEGFKIYFNKDDDWVNAFRVLKTVLDEEIKDKRPQLDYIDLRFGNKVFYKLLP
ncbi:MAG: FtsQ-type POTRA domain-containing protein [Candidatus Sungiibacteriota bacterium]|uniref:FtsQ-type POTRA domain-containing protein n=1 Tax=Candidatus Sungiibacteriota bacterium TaxID=2750080 RepID=A0A7T5UR63_9BACT|nr:MAG: FtsQ-type POTRA domain-containing protein [Candidatus Sungbacteria bacterium]